MGLKEGGGGGRGRKGVSLEGVQGPPSSPGLGQAAVKRDPVFFPRPVRRETLPWLAGVKSRR